MINLDEEIYFKLKSGVNLGKITIIQGYPTQYYDLPVLSYTCENNTCALKTDGREVTSYIVYKLDLFLDNNEEDYIFYYEDVDNMMTDLGFKRTQFTMINEPNGGIHIVFRYEVYITEQYYTYNSIY